MDGLNGISQFINLVMCHDSSCQTYFKWIGNYTYFIIVADNADYWKTDGQVFMAHLLKYSKGMVLSESEKFGSRGCENTKLIRVLTSVQRKRVIEFVHEYMEKYERDEAYSARM